MVAHRARGAQELLQDRVVIVTGASGGIGTAAAMTLARAGATVVLSDVTEHARATVEAIRGADGRASFIRADVGREEEVEELVRKTVSTYGRLDGAFNNAGVEQCATALAELTAEQWERALRIDLTGVFFCLKHQIRAMLGSGGSIVNTASALGAVALPNAAEYVAAKHAVAGLTKAAAADYAARGIRVNAVLPGIINTPMVNRLTGDPVFAELFQRLRERHPIGRFGEPMEVAEAVLWLLSERASFVNGAMLPVDGGYLAV